MVRTKKCKYCSRSFSNIDFPRTFKRQITCGSIECIGKRRFELYKKRLGWGNMNQKIICHRGICAEDGSLETEFDEIFDSNNIVDKIERDLLQSMIN